MASFKFRIIKSIKKSEEYCESIKAGERKSYSENGVRTKKRTREYSFLMSSQKPNRVKQREKERNTDLHVQILVGNS